LAEIRLISAEFRARSGIREDKTEVAPEREAQESKRI
jgi:hypothetical protein